MEKMISSWLIVFIYAVFLTDCSSSRIPPRNEATGGPNVGLVASKLPEVSIMADGLEQDRGKILRLDGELLKFLPYPYWNTEVLEIPLEKVLTIKILGAKSKAGSLGLAGMTLGFIIIGGLAGSGAEYKDDYESAYTGGLLVGVGAGLLGGIIGGLIDLGKKKRYEFSSMTKAQKVQALLRIMGL
jgi:hypothetical protein